jgi:hypothetical protein
MHTGGQGAHLKTSKNLGHKKATKHQNRRKTRLEFFTTPSTPLKEFENDCASMVSFSVHIKAIKNWFFTFCLFYFLFAGFSSFLSSIGLGITCQLCINLARKKHK